MRPCGDKPIPQGIIHVKMSVFKVLRLFWLSRHGFFNSHYQKYRLRPCGDRPRLQGIIHIKMSVFKVLKLFWQSSHEFLICGDFFDSRAMSFWSVETFLTVETWVFDLSSPKVLIQNMLRQIETSTPTGQIERRPIIEY